MWIVQLSESEYEMARHMAQEIVKRPCGYGVHNYTPRATTRTIYRAARESLYQPRAR